jgi:hypothetical protein
MNNFLKRLIEAALRNPKTTIAGISAVVLGASQLSAGQAEAGVTGIVTGLGLIVSVDAGDKPEPPKE